MHSSIFIDIRFVVECDECIDYVKQMHRLSDTFENSCLLFFVLITRFCHLKLIVWICEITEMAFLLRQLAKPALQRNLLLSTNSLRHAAKDVAASANTQQQKQLQISESCLKRLREICVDGSFLRITVEGGGCSGFQYKFDLDGKLNEDDLQFGEEKAKVVIDTISLDYCSGATVDYTRELIREGFRMVANPLAEQGCSCGSSFAVKL